LRPRKKRTSGLRSRLIETARPRKIIHVDMDAFYASVEQRDRPELKGKPVIVGGSPQKRGVVAACSYEARKFGIRSAMSASTAYRLCPQAVFLSPDFNRYRKVSYEIREIFESVTDKVEPLSLDEAYLDVTENKLSEPLARVIAEHIRKRIRNELNLTASAGVGPNKFIAKVASDFKKPDGLVVVPPERVNEFVEALPVEKLWGVGPVTAKRLHERGFFKAGDIRRANPAELHALLGKFGDFIYDLSFGRDDREVEAHRESKSTGTETTFERDILDRIQLEDYLLTQSEEISEDLKKNDLTGRTITLKVKYSDFKSITRSRTLMKSTDDNLVIFRTARELMGTNTEAGYRPIRLIGISISNFIDLGEPEQLCFDFEIP